MPTYDYRCNACGHEFEAFQSITAPVMRKCPACGKPKLERLIGAGAGIIFKGGGFYETDYRSESYRKAAEAESKAGSSAESGAGGSAGTEGKAQPKSDTTANGSAKSDTGSRDRDRSAPSTMRAGAGRTSSARAGSTDRTAPRTGATSKKQGKTASASRTTRSRSRRSGGAG